VFVVVRCGGSPIYNPSALRVFIFLMFLRGISTIQHLRLRMYRDDNSSVVSGSNVVI
jgi:hypothetical protein